MKNRVAQCDRSARILDAVFKCLAAAVIFLLISGCGSDKDSKETGAGQSSEEKAPLSVEQLFAARTGEIQKRIKAAFDRIETSKGYKFGDTELMETEITSRFYQQRQFRPAWIKINQIDDLIRTI